jgi:hypothetical protein
VADIDTNGTALREWSYLDMDAIALVLGDAAPATGLMVPLSWTAQGDDDMPTDDATKDKDDAKAPTLSASMRAVIETLSAASRDSVSVAGLSEAQACALQAASALLRAAKVDDAGDRLAKAGALPTIAADADVEPAQFTEPAFVGGEPSRGFDMSAVPSDRREIVRAQWTAVQATKRADAAMAEVAKERRQRRLDQIRVQCREDLSFVGGERLAGVLLAVETGESVVQADAEELKKALDRANRLVKESAALSAIGSALGGETGDGAMATIRAEADKLQGANPDRSPTFETAYAAFTKTDAGRKLLTQHYQEIGA